MSSVSISSIPPPFFFIASSAQEVHYSWEGYKLIILKNLRICSSHISSLAGRARHIMPGAKLGKALIIFSTAYIAYKILGLITSSYNFVKDLGELVRWARCQTRNQKSRNVAKKKIIECFWKKNSRLDLLCFELTSLPKLLGTYPELQELDLCHNCLSEFPEFIQRFPSLTKLNLRNNKISGFPDWLFDLPQKITCDLKSNYFSISELWRVQQRNRGQVSLILSLNVEHYIQINLENDDLVLHVAADHGLLNEVKELLRIPGININELDKNGETALMKACSRAYRKGSEEMVELLLSHPKININELDKNGETALIKACREEREEMVGVLLNHPYIDINKKSREGFSAIDFAIRNKHSRIISALLRYQPPAESGLRPVDLNIRKDNGKTILMTLFERKDYSAVHCCLQRPDIDWHIVDKEGFKVSDRIAFKELEPTEFSADYCSVAICLLSQQHSNGKGYGYGLFTEVDFSHLLLYAISYMEDPLAGELAVQILGHNIKGEIFLDVLTTNKKGNNALHLAAMKGSIDLVRTLVLDHRMSKNINDPGDESKTALIYASIENHGDIVHFLLQQGANETLQDIRGNNALTWAASRGAVEAIQELLSFNHLVNSAGNYGTPLIEAIRMNRAEAAKMLIPKMSEEAFRYVHMVESLFWVYRKTALEIAINKNMFDVAEMIIQRIPFGLENVPVLLSKVADSNDEQVINLFLAILDKDPSLGSALYAEVQQKARSSAFSNERIQSLAKVLNIRLRRVNVSFLLDKVVSSNDEQGINLFLAVVNKDPGRVVSISDLVRKKVRENPQYAQSETIQFLRKNLWIQGSLVEEDSFAEGPLDPEIGQVEIVSEEMKAYLPINDLIKLTLEFAGVK